MVEPKFPLYLCQVCRRPLDEFDEMRGDVVIATHLRHGYMIPGTPDHEPVPILASEVGNEQVGVCDFCAGTPPVWRYKAASFEGDVPFSEGRLGYGSVEDWAACEQCHTDIERDRWRQIANRALEKHGPMRVEERRLLRQQLLAFHRLFVKARKGDPERLFPATG